MNDPYRAPEVPASTLAERRLAERTAMLARAGALARARRARRRRLARTLLIAITCLSASYIAIGIVLRLTWLRDVGPWLNASILVCAIALPMSFLFALGMKVPPAEGNPFGGLPNGGDRHR